MPTETAVISPRYLRRKNLKRPAQSLLTEIGSLFPSNGEYKLHRPASIFRTRRRAGYISGWEIFWIVPGTPLHPIVNLQATIFPFTGLIFLYNL